LERQDSQAVEGQTDQRGQRLVLRVGEQFFIGLLGLFPGVLVGISAPQVGIEAFDLRGRQLVLQSLVLLEPGARLFVVLDGLLDGEDRRSLHSSLHAVAVSSFDLS
jgi:hypothetical protein